MKVCVVYESMYGNTHDVATAIAAGLEHVGDVLVGAVGDVAPISVADVNLLVVGGPTHVHGMSRASSREAAVAEAETSEDITLDDDAPGPGLRTWLSELPNIEEMHGAAFDTRIDKPVILTGSAARGIAKRLRRHGLGLITPPESFLVGGSSGPLLAGELERARRWGTDLAHELARLDRAKPRTTR